MPDLKPLSIAIYRHGPAWVEGRKLRDQETLLDHGRFLAALERSGQAVHAAPAHRLDEVPTCLNLVRTCTRGREAPLG